MAIRVELRQLHSGEPVRPDVNPRVDKSGSERVVERSNVTSARDLAEKNAEESRTSILEIGATAGKIARDFSAGKVDFRI